MRDFLIFAENNPWLAIALFWPAMVQVHHMLKIANTLARQITPFYRQWRLANDFRIMRDVRAALIREFGGVVALKIIYRCPELDDAHTLWQNRVTKVYGWKTPPSLT